MPSFTNLILIAPLALLPQSDSVKNLPDPDPAYTACAAKASTTVQMEECGKAGLDNANRRLNAVYQKSLLSLPTDRQAKLRTSERTWIIFREQDCRVLLGTDTGTMAAPAYLDCMVDRTETRIRDIEGLVRR